jgi:hypothetical protein
MTGDVDLPETASGPQDGKFEEDRERNTSVAGWSSTETGGTAGIEAVGKSSTEVLSAAGERKVGCGMLIAALAFTILVLV